MREPTAPSYYDHRTPEYDDWYLGHGLHASRVLLAGDWFVVVRSRR